MALSRSLCFLNSFLPLHDMGDDQEHLLTCGVGHHREFDRARELTGREVQRGRQALPPSPRPRCPPTPGWLPLTLQHLAGTFRWLSVTGMLTHIQPGFLLTRLSFLTRKW